MRSDQSLRFLIAVALPKGAWTLRIALTCATLVLLATSLTANTSAQSDTRLSYWERVTRDEQSIYDFVDYLNRPEASHSAIVQRADSLISQLNASVPEYSMLGTPPEGQRITAGITQFLIALEDYRRSFATSDAKLSDWAVTRMNSALGTIDEGLAQAQQVQQERYQQAAKEEQSVRNLIVGGFIASIGLSAGLRYLAHRQPQDPIGDARAFAYMAMFRSSLLMVAGFAVTLVTYFSSFGGGGYIVAWGAVAAGALALISRVFTYFTQVRPRLVNLMSKSICIEEVQTAAK